MRITNNMVTNTILNEVQSLDSQQSTLQTQVSSGLAVTQASDNPSAYAQIVQLEGQSDELTQYASNAQQALNTAQSSYSALQSLTQIYDSASQIGTQGTDGALGSDSTDYASELNEVIQQAVQVANSQFDGNYLFAGTAVSQAPFTATTDSSGDITGVTYGGNSQQAAIPLSATSSVSPSTSGTTNTGIAAFINQLVSLRDALSSSDTAGATTALSQLQSSDNVLTSAVAENGAIQMRIGSDQTQATSSETEVTSLISSASDADLPSTITKLNQAQLAYQAALQTAASVMHLSILNYVQLS